jgi:hypothetical protein
MSVRSVSRLSAIALVVTAGVALPGLADFLTTESPPAAPAVVIPDAVTASLPFLPLTDGREPAPAPREGTEVGHRIE